MPRHVSGHNQWITKDIGSEIHALNRDRRLNFKQSRYGGTKNGRDWSNLVREHLQDEDVDMGLSSSSGRYYKKRFNNNRGGKKGRKGSPVPSINRKLLVGPTNWYRVWSPYGGRYEKDVIMKIIQEKIAPLTFWPIMYQSNGRSFSFYIDDFKVAEKLHILDRLIQLPNGSKLQLGVSSGTPNVEVTSTMKEKMKLVMAKRYNAATKALDLTKFHADPDLQEYFCSLFKPIVFLAIIDIIVENIPELEALNLYDNKISVLSFLKKSIKKLTNLKVLHMGNNKLREISQLDVLQGLPIVDLVLDGNPLCEKFKEQAPYISEVRKRFPKCMKLDGIELPPPISFDIVEEHHLPDKQQTFLCNSEGGSIVRQFLEQYFLIYDTENRQSLLQAYHENASFSLTMGYPYGYGKEQKVAWLNWYATDNRNILRVTNSDRRLKLLKQGQLAVVSFLQEMPFTKHDIHSFTVDLTLFTPQMLCLSVSGIFRELKSGHKYPPTRFFFRTLVIVPAGTGFCIANETLHVSNATPEQARGAFKPPIEPAPSNHAVASVSSPVVAPVPVPVPVPVAPADAKTEMVQQMSTQSGMNLEWSLKCLEENQWDFQRACVVFQQLQSQGVIPPEAFVK